MIEFLEVMFIPDYSTLHTSSEKNILALDDEHYGKAMKLFYLKKEENRQAIEEIKTLGKRVSPKGSPQAPQ